MWWSNTEYKPRPWSVHALVLFVQHHGFRNQSIQGNTVLEPVPIGEPVTWCHRMVICAKKLDNLNEPMTSKPSTSTLPGKPSHHSTNLMVSSTREEENCFWRLEWLSQRTPPPLIQTLLKYRRDSSPPATGTPGIWQNHLTDPQQNQMRGRYPLMGRQNRKKLFPSMPLAKSLR